jgi:hypothetical protein
MKGFGGATRTIKIHLKKVHNCLRSDYAPQTEAQLFPELNGAAGTGSGNPEIVSALFTIPQQYAGGSLDGLTAAVIHDSFHADQKRRSVKSSGRNAEIEASTFAVPILEKLGVDEHIINTYREDAKRGHPPWTETRKPPKMRTP